MWVLVSSIPFPPTHSLSLSSPSSAYYTSHIGVNYKHTSFSFYQDSFSTKNGDQHRVHLLFAKARESGVPVVPITLKLDDLKRFLFSPADVPPEVETPSSPPPSSMLPHLQIKYAAIVLVKLGSLKCRLCKEANRPKLRSIRQYWIRRMRRIKEKAARAEAEEASAATASATSSSTYRVGKKTQGFRESVCGFIGSLFCCIPSRSLEINSPGGDRLMEQGGLENHYNSTNITPPYRKHISATAASSSASSTPIRYNNNSSSDPTNKSSSTAITDDFIGHYILLVGYDPEDDLFYYRDPGYEDDLCCMDSFTLEQARSHAGTDHDSIIVRLE